MTERDALREDRIVQASWAGTALFAATTLPSAFGAEVGSVAVVVALVLFIASIPISLFSLARAAVRVARLTERITVTGLFFLLPDVAPAKGGTEVAPRSVRRHLLAALVVTVLVTAITASDEPFGVLVPVYPLSLVGLWGALLGTYPQIPDPGQGRRPAA